MARIRGRGNVATELRLIELFKQHGVRGWRRNYQAFGKPDFVFRAKRIAVFVDGDFWHGHPTKGQMPATNRDFWQAKISRNKKRDRMVNQTLKKRGWTVVRIWQSDLASTKWWRKIRRVIRPSGEGTLPSSG
jgi:DNA mismatch endonuclease (patch repair protein)